MRNEVQELIDDFILRKIPCRDDAERRLWFQENADKLKLATAPIGQLLEEIKLRLFPREPNNLAHDKAREFQEGFLYAFKSTLNNPEYASTYHNQLKEQSLARLISVPTEAGNLLGGALGGYIGFCLISEGFCVVGFRRNELGHWTIEEERLWRINSEAYRHVWKRGNAAGYFSFVMFAINKLDLITHHERNKLEALEKVMEHIIKSQTASVETMERYIAQIERISKDLEQYILSNLNQTRFQSASLVSNGSTIIPFINEMMRTGQCNFDYLLQELGRNEHIYTKIDDGLKNAAVQGILYGIITAIVEAFIHKAKTQQQQKNLKNSLILITRKYQVPHLINPILVKINEIMAEEHTIEHRATNYAHFYSRIMGDQGQFYREFMKGVHTQANIDRMATSNRTPTPSGWTATPTPNAPTPTLPFMPTPTI